MRHLLIPIDLSEATTASLSYVDDLPDVAERKVTVCIVVNDEPPPALAWGHTRIDPELLMDGLKDEYRTRIRQLVTKLMPNSTNVSVMVLLSGKPPHEPICRAAAKIRADEIVMTSHGCGGALSVGSVATSVVAHSTCPVVVLTSGSGIGPTVLTSQPKQPDRKNES